LKKEHLRLLNTIKESAKGPGAQKRKGIRGILGDLTGWRLCRNKDISSLVFETYSDTVYSTVGQSPVSPPPIFSLVAAV